MIMMMEKLVGSQRLTASAMEGPYSIIIIIIIIIISGVGRLVLRPLLAYGHTVMCLYVIFCHGHHIENKFSDFKYVGVLIGLWLFLLPIFLFTAQLKECFFDWLNKLEQ
jgi:hypothetical protein